MCFDVRPLHIPYKYWAVDYLRLAPDASERERQTVVDKWKINFLTIERWLDEIRGSEGEADQRGGFIFSEDSFSADGAKTNYIRLMEYVNGNFEPSGTGRCSVTDDKQKYLLQIPYPSWAVDLGANTSQEHNNYTVIERWAERLVARWNNCSCGGCGYTFFQGGG